MINLEAVKEAAINTALTGGPLILGYILVSKVIMPFLVRRNATAIERIQQKIDDAKYKYPYLDADLFKEASTVFLHHVENMAYENNVISEVIDTLPDNIESSVVFNKDTNKVVVRFNAKCLKEIEEHYATSEYKDIQSLEVYKAYTVLLACIFINTPVKDQKTYKKHLRPYIENTFPYWVAATLEMRTQFSEDKEINIIKGGPEKYIDQKKVKYSYLEWKESQKNEEVA